MEDRKTKKYVLKKTGWIVLLMAMILVGSTCGERYAGSGKDPRVYAWWGTIYPEFCFEKAEDDGENKPVKISFWLAQALDW